MRNNTVELRWNEVRPDKHLCDFFVPYKDKFVKFHACYLPWVGKVLVMVYIEDDVIMPTCCERVEKEGLDQMCIDMANNYIKENESKAVANES